MIDFFRNKILLAISLLGLVLFLSLSLSVKPAISDDTPTYTGCAIALSHGQAFGCDPSRTPGYPMLIMLTDTVFGGLGYNLTVWVQYALLIASGYLIYKLSLLLFKNQTAAYASFFLVLTYPLFLFYSNNILTEIPFVFFLTAFAYWTIKYIYAGRLPDLALASLFLSIATLTRPFASYFLLILIALVLWVKGKNWKQTATHSAVAILICLVLFVPWMYKNYKQFGSFKLQYLSGIALWTNVYNVDKLPLTNSPAFQKEIDLIRSDPGNAYKILEQNGYSQAEYDTVLMGVSLAAIKAHPAQYMASTVKNFTKLTLYPKYAFGDYLVKDQTENLRPGNLSRYTYYFFNDTAHKFNYPVILLTLFAIWGICIGLKNSDKKGKAAIIFLAAVTLACLAIPAATIIPNVRYRIVIDQFLMIFAAYAVVMIIKNWRKKLFGG